MVGGLVMTTAELQEQGAIYFDKITEGFRNYKDIKLVMDEKRALAHFKNLKKEYGNNKAFADFYYYRLDLDSREMVDEVLTDAEKTYLNLMMPEDLDEDIVFPLDDKLLNIIVKLNAEEILFSPIYFLPSEKAGGRGRTTWWGNYEKEYICFCDK